MDFEECCRRVLASTRTNGYAKAYARSGIEDIPMLFPGEKLREAQRVQALYILNNITAWRGEDSKEVRTRLKELSKKDK